MATKFNIGDKVRLKFNRRTGVVVKTPSEDSENCAVDYDRGDWDYVHPDDLELITPAQPPADTPPTLEDVLCDQPQPFIVSSLMLKFLSSGEFIYLVREIVREGYSIPEAQTIAKHLNAQADKEWLVTRNTQPADTPPATVEIDVEALREQNARKVWSLRDEQNKEDMWESLRANATPPAAPSETTANDNPHLTSKIFSEQTLRLQAAEKVIEAAKEYIAALEAESTSRLNALNEKAEELRREWQRAESAEAERDALRRKLDELTSYITAALAYFDNPEFVNATDMTYSERMAGVWSQLEATKGASDG